MAKILIIEDNFHVRDNLCEILELYGYESMQASNGKEGIRIALQEKPDLIICDIMMPELDGYGVIKILKESEIAKDIPVIFLTAKAEKDDLRKGMRLGAADYLTKPFDDAELLEVVKMRIQVGNNSHLNKITAGTLDLDVFDKKIKALCENTESRQFSNKEYIYKKGKQPFYLYFIIKGKVKIKLENQIGKSIISNIYTKGQVIGLQALITKTEYKHDAISLFDTEVALIPKESFMHALYSDISFTGCILKSLSKSLQSANQKILNQAYGSVRYKVANTLLQLHKVFEKSTITLSRDDIAEIAGTAKESTIRTLSDFKNANLIKIKGSDIEILDIEGLKAIPV